jgi:Right handed beta helix region
MVVSVAAAEQGKESGNLKFKEKKYAAAALDYTVGLEALLLTTKNDDGDGNCNNNDPDPLTSSLRTALYSNRAACHDALGRYEEAAADARSALRIDPTHVKSYFRLAKSLLQLLAEDDGSTNITAEAGRAVCAAVALSRGQIDATLANLYRLVRSRLEEEASSSSSASTERMRLPLQASSIKLVAPDGSMTIATAFRWERTSTVVCALPGIYTTDVIEIVHGTENAIIGLGGCVVNQAAAGMMNTVVVTPDASAYLFGLRLGGGNRATSQACIAVCGKDVMVDGCRVEGYAGGGLLIVDDNASATVKNCSFHGLPMMAIEVQEGGSLVGSNLSITRCRQGICAYGGAKKVVLSDCTVRDCLREGIFLEGTFVNAATMAQQSLRKKHNVGAQPKTQPQQVSEAAQKWGISRGIQLCASVQNTTVRNCHFLAFPSIVVPRC